MNTKIEDKSNNGSATSADDDLIATGIAVGGTVASVAIAAAAPVLLALFGIGVAVFALLADDGSPGDGGDGSTAGWGG